MRQRPGGSDSLTATKTKRKSLDAARWQHASPGDIQKCAMLHKVTDKNVLKHSFLVFKANLKQLSLAQQP